MKAFYTDPTGTTHCADVIEARGPKMSVIEYWDNARRGTRFKSGRRYNHGTRARVIVFNHELRPVEEKS